MEENSIGKETQRPERKVVEANGFVLKDDAGKVRASLTLSPEGEPVFRLNGPDGGLRVGMIATDSGLSSFDLWDAQGNERGTFRVYNNGVYLQLIGSHDASNNGKAGHITIEAQASGDYVISFWKEGEPVTVLGITPDGTTLYLDDKELSRFLPKIQGTTRSAQGEAQEEGEL